MVEAVSGFADTAYIISKTDTRIALDIQWVASTIYLNNSVITYNFIFSSVLVDIDMSNAVLSSGEFPPMKGERTAHIWMDLF